MEKGEVIYSKKGEKGRKGRLPPEMMGQNATNCGCTELGGQNGCLLAGGETYENRVRKEDEKKRKKKKTTEGGEKKSRKKIRGPKTKRTSTPAKAKATAKPQSSGAQQFVALLTQPRSGQGKKKQGKAGGNNIGRRDKRHRGLEVLTHFNDQQPAHDSGAQKGRKKTVQWEKRGKNLKSD